MTTGTVFDIRKYSIHDGPGIRTTVFFKGCPLRCAWCHNPESQAFSPQLILRLNRCILCEACLQACPHHAIRREDGSIITNRELCQQCGICTDACTAEGRQLTGRKMSVDAVMAEIEQDRAFYDQSNGGATFSGGEPLAQREFLLELLRMCKARGIHTALDTSGFAAWPVLDEVRPLVDVFLYDIKMVDEERHQYYTGVPVKPILNNLRMLSDHGENIIIRMPLIPGVNDDEKTLNEVGTFLASLPHLHVVELLLYHEIGLAKYAGLGMDYSLTGLRPPEEDHLAGVVAILRGYGLEVKI
jgi:pyruvate formate lyase activating enzyme